jgi:hypothetical protein
VVAGTRIGAGTSSQLRYFSWRSSIIFSDIQMLGLFLVDHGEWSVDYSLLGNKGGIIGGVKQPCGLRVPQTSQSTGSVKG